MLQNKTGQQTNKGKLGSSSSGHGHEEGCLFLRSQPPWLSCLPTGNPGQTQPSVSIPAQAAPSKTLLNKKHYHNHLKIRRQSQSICCWEDRTRGLFYSVVMKLRRDVGGGTGSWYPQLLRSSRNRKWWSHHTTHQPDNSMGHQRQRSWPHPHR